MDVIKSFRNICLYWWLSQRGFYEYLNSKDNIGIKLGLNRRFLGRDSALLLCGLIELLLATTNEMRLPYNSSLGCFNATIGETGMEQRTLFDAYLVAI